MQREGDETTTENSRVSNDYKDPEDFPLDREVTMADFLNMLRRLSEDLRALTRAITPASPKYQRCDNLVDTLEGLRTVTADVVRAVHHVHDKL